MGRRTRKRVLSVAAPPRAAPAVRPGRGPAGARPRPPKAPWAPVPLAEGAILAGVVCLAIGLARGADRSPWLVGVGFALVSFAALEVSVREHLAGYRSHSVLLAGALAVAVAAAAYLLTGIPQEAILVGAVVVGGVALPALRALFRRRSGGLGFRA